MKKADCIIIAVVVALSALLYFVFYQNPTDEMRVSISIDGETVRSDRITDIESQIVIENSYGRNIIEIKDGAVEVIWSNCVSQVCVRTGKISRPGEVIVCLPHHLLIAVEDGRQPEDIDAVAW